MSISRDSWLPLAEKLQLQDGRSRRVNHDCGEGRTLLLSRDGPKLRAWCFRCNDGDGTTVEEPLADRIARLQAMRSAELLHTGGSGTPPDGELDPSKWPAEARLWFARAGLHSADAGALRARYVPSLGRLVLPLGDSFWQGRALYPGQVPKYLAPLTPKVYPRYGKADTVTLCEDILSAYKVGKVGEGWCMLGTALPPELLAAILNRGCAVNVWLDNDLPPVHQVNRGQIAARKVVTQLRRLGVSVRNIVSTKDPKLLFVHEIKELLA